MPLTSARSPTVVALIVRTLQGAPTIANTGADHTLALPTACQNRTNSC